MKAVEGTTSARASVAPSAQANTNDSCSFFMDASVANTCRAWASHEQEANTSYRRPVHRHQDSLASYTLRISPAVKEIRMTDTALIAPALTVMTVNIHKGFTTFNRKFILPELRDA